jgi:transglutaminase-like putative cysteine protease
MGVALRAFGSSASWFDLDPANDVLADQGRMTFAVGRDYSDVSLLRGAILGGGTHRMEVAVRALANGARLDEQL